MIAFVWLILARKLLSFFEIFCVSVQKPGLLHFNFHSGKKDAVTHTKAPQYPESHAIMKVYSLGTLEEEDRRSRCSSYFVSQTGIKILLEVLGFYEKGFRLLIIMKKRNRHWRNALENLIELHTFVLS